MASMWAGSTGRTRNVCSTRMHRPGMPPPGICCSFVRGSSWRKVSIRTGWKRKETHFQLPNEVTGETTLSASPAGPIVYRTSSADSGQRQLVWVDRSGREIDKVVYSDRTSQGPSLSPDGRRVAVFRYASGNNDIWTYDVARRGWDRVTFYAGDDIFPLWSPDGRQHRVRFAAWPNEYLLEAPQRSTGTR